MDDLSSAWQEQIHQTEVKPYIFYIITSESMTATDALIHYKGRLV